MNARYVELAKKMFSEFHTEYNYFNQRSKNFNIKNEEAFEKKKKQIIAEQVEEKLKNYKGITFKEMDAIEEHFKCAISVVELKEDGRTILKRWSEKEDAPRYRSAWFNQYHNHFSFIRNIGALRNSFCCDRCLKQFKTQRELTRHVNGDSKNKRKNSCDVRFVDKFLKRTKVYKPKENILKRMYKKYPEYFKDIDLYTKFFNAFDFEAVLVDIDVKSGDNTSFNKQHVPLSSIRSNLKNETDKTLLCS